MTPKQRAQFGYYQRKKYLDPLGFKAITQYSSFRSNIYKWRDSMGKLLQQRDDLEVELAQAVKVVAHPVKILTVLVCLVLVVGQEIQESAVKTKEEAAG